MSTGSSSRRRIDALATGWHARDTADVFTAMRTGPLGLRPKEVQERRRTFGLNDFTRVREPGIVSRVAAQFKSPLALVLVGAFVLTIVLGEYVDAGVISFALAIAIVVGVLQEGKASRAFRVLANAQVHTATVVRGGVRHEILASELVRGDVVEIHGGMDVPADLRLIEVTGLMTNEASLTGEWMPVRKNVETLPVGASFSEQTNMAWKGTLAIEGYGRGVVVAIGDSTAVGAIAQSLHHIEDEATPLQNEMKRASHIMLGVIGVVVTLIFVFGILNDQPIEDMLLVVIAIAVASVPEGLPAAVTIILAVGMEALLRRGGLVRNLLAAETLGSTTYILTDKTGTLTLAQMALTGVIHGDATNASPRSWERDAAVRHIFEIALCASDAYVEKKNGEEVFRGDPIERAILSASREIGLHTEKDSLRASRSRFVEFTSENRFAAGVVPQRKGKRLLCINGAPEYLLSLASKVREGGKERAITDEDREAYAAAITAQTKEGKRLIAVAYREGDADVVDSPDAPLAALLTTDLVFAGILVFTDPIRKRVAIAIRGVQNAGAAVLLVTGDNPDTALAVARTVGIAGRHETALTGDDLEHLTDNELLEVIESVHVFARVLPSQKMRIAQVLQQRGEIVAMTGDGTNDAPALRRANIGIALGSGTEVAKEAADLVLVEDSFEVIYAAIEEGRRIVANLRKVVGYLFSTSLSEVVLIGAALATGSALPLLPAQILWANVIEEGLMSFAFAFEKGEKNAMKRKPQDIYAEGILSITMLGFIFFVTMITGIILVALYMYVRSLGLPIETVRSVMFLMIAMDSLFMAFAFRSLSTPLWRLSMRTNVYFGLTILLNLCLLAVVLTIPWFQTLLSYQPLPLSYIGLVIAAGFATLATIEVGKWLFFSDSSENDPVVP